MYIPQDKINEIRSKADIVNIINRYVPLVRKGKNFFGICPFHDDHEPSMSVNPEKQIFKCFVCGTGGNIFEFIKQYENISFQEAVKKVADMVDVKLDLSAQIHTEDPALKRAKEIVADTAKYANFMIRSEEGIHAKAYALERLGDAALDYGIGYIDSSADMINFLEKKGYTKAEMVDAGLINQNDQSFLEKRLIIPIQNKYGNDVGFGTRRLDENADAKYINSPESSLFKKGELLFNHHAAANDIRNNKAVIVVEGYMDALKCRSVGIENTVATMGTAMTKAQCKELKDMRVPVKLCYDGDTAGIKAAMKNHTLLTENGVKDVRMVLLPDGKDPDELIKEDAAGFKALLSENNNIMDFYLKTYTSDGTFGYNSQYAMEALKLLKTMENPLAEDFYLKRLSEITGFKPNALSKQYEILCGKNEQQIYRANRSQTSKTKESIAKAGNKYVKVNFGIKKKFSAMNQIQSNYDRLRDTDKMLAFDETNLLSRQDLLKKYIDLKGPVLSTQITLINYDDVDYKAQAIASAVINSVADEVHADKANLDYIGYLHKDTKHPHVHLDIYQKEPYLSNYTLSSKLVDQIERSVKKSMEALPEIKTNSLEDAESMIVAEPIKIG